MRTVAVTSCQFERSGIVLKRLNTYLSASMGQDRLNALGFMHINHIKYFVREIGHLSLQHLCFKVQYNVIL